MTRVLAAPRTISQVGGEYWRPAYVVAIASVKVLAIDEPRHPRNDYDITRVVDMVTLFLIPSDELFFIASRL